MKKYYSFQSLEKFEILYKGLNCKTKALIYPI